MVDELVSKFEFFKSQLKVVNVAILIYCFLGLNTRCYIELNYSIKCLACYFASMHHIKDKPDSQMTGCTTKTKLPKTQQTCSTHRGTLGSLTSSGLMDQRPLTSFKPLPNEQPSAPTFRCLSWHKQYSYSTNSNWVVMLA